MKIYQFEKKFPYSAIVGAENVEQAQEIYFSDVCTPGESDQDEPWVSELPNEITRELALEYMSDETEDTSLSSKETYLNKILVDGIACLIAIDATLV